VHAFDPDEVLRRFEVRRERGLDEETVRARRKRHGPNRLQETETRPWWRILLQQFESIVVYLLGAGAAVAFATQRWPEAWTVLAVILVNAGIGFVSEWRAVRSMAALRELGERTARVRREDAESEISASELVPGDIVLVRAPELVPADLRILESSGLRVNEASLTGESLPREKRTEAVEPETELADRVGMLYKGTSVVDGSAESVVVATGSRTELGQIAKLAEEAESAVPPLQQRLDRLGRTLAWVTIGIGVLVAALGFLLRRQEAALVIETALALGIAAIPEGLPVVATIALAHGMRRMAERRVLVNRLTAVETLGATRVIFSDKTGTLTENRMQLRTVVTPAGSRELDDTDEPDGEADGLVRRVVEVGVQCNSASLEEEGHEDSPRGDPTEVALLQGGAELGIDRERLLEDRPTVRVEEFDPEVKKMATFHREEGGFQVAVKGAPRAVLDCCDSIAGRDDPDVEREPSSLDDATRRHWLEQAEDLAGRGLRVLAMADKRTESDDAEPYSGLRFLGLVGLVDPPREDVKEAIDRCQAAGIRVEMVTGDQPETARAIAEEVGIVGDPEDPEPEVLRGADLRSEEGLEEELQQRVHHANIFARVSPAQKLDLVRIYQDQGEVVAMTGDGVNDAPALKKADIGIAMGRRGTEAARQVADMVLEDDSLQSIVAAVERGRLIVDNIRKAVLFMLCTNVAEVFAVTVATFAGWTLPLRPLQILYLNVLTDVFPALALGVGPRSGREMERGPRPPRQRLLTQHLWAEIAGWAGLLAACVLTGMLLAENWLGLGSLEAVTVSFLTLGFGKLWFTFNLRSPESGALDNEVTRNPWVWAAIVVCSALLVAAESAPGLSGLLATRPLDGRGWGLVLGLSLFPLLVGQVVRSIQGRRPNGD
jgi:Ca2+-transporting ATPase